MCLSLIAEADHATFDCVQTVIYWFHASSQTLRTLAMSQVTNKSSVAKPFALVQLVPHHAKTLPTDGLSAVTDLCRQTNAIASAPRYTYRWGAHGVGDIVYRSLNEPQAPQIPLLELDRVEVKKAVGGCVQVVFPTPLPKMQAFVQQTLSSILHDATPDYVVRTLDAINDALMQPHQLGQTGFRPVFVPDAKSIFDEGIMDEYQSALRDAMVSACGMLVVKMAVDEIVKSCDDLAPVILREIFGDMPTLDTFDVSRRFDHPGVPLNVTQINAMRIRDTMAAHLDCNYVLLCTSVMDPGESTKAVMMFETKPGEDLPMPGMCHEDRDCTIETNVVLASPLSVNLSGLVPEGEDPNCCCMDKDDVWNADSHDDAVELEQHDLLTTDTRVLDEQRKSRIDIKAAMEQDLLEPISICGARRIPKDRRLDMRCVSVPCKLS